MDARTIAISVVAYRKSFVIGRTLIKGMRIIVAIPALISYIKILFMVCVFMDGLQ